jgi:predicted alpha-1,6-mannanase (GH76 family)
MERVFYDPASSDYRERPGASPGSHAWPYSQALAAQIAIASVPRLASRAAVRARLAQLDRRFRQGAMYTAWPSGDVYLDDNEWLAEDLLAWSSLTGDPVAGQRAEAIFAAITDAWDDVPTHPCPGGVFWTSSSANRDRNTVSTANGAIIALRLYVATSDPSYLAWAKTMLAWLDQCMRAPNGLYWDHIDLAGTVNTSEWSYNQGSVIEASLLLYESTGDATALSEAERVADASIDYFDSRWRKGEPAEFAAVFFRSLLALAAVDGDTDYLDAARSYGDDAWLSARNAKTGLFRYSGRASLLQQAAFVQLYAALAAFPTDVR